ncbi:hypothetical protein HDU83_004646 [Entophlyctis luteolus]|nr:hypothetical protein HDU83_004646 [Entophlyctis luteolus]
MPSSVPFPSPLDVLAHATLLSADSPVSSASPASPDASAPAVSVSPVSLPDPEALPVKRKRGRPPRNPDHPASLARLGKKVRMAAENLLALVQGGATQSDSSCASDSDAALATGGIVKIEGPTTENVAAPKDEQYQDVILNGLLQHPELDSRRISSFMHPDIMVQLPHQDSNYDKVENDDVADISQSSQSSRYLRGRFQFRNLNTNGEEEETDKYEDEGATSSDYNNDDDEDYDSEFDCPTRQSSIKSLKVRMPMQRRMDSVGSTTSSVCSQQETSGQESGKRFDCNECGRSFSRLFNLKSHLHTHNPARAKSFSCELCGVGFCRQQDLMRHATVHDKSKIMKCPQCPGKTFSRKDALRRHIRLNGCCDMSVLNSL